MFKVGDKVKALCDAFGGLTKGKEYIITGSKLINNEEAYFVSGISPNKGYYFAFRFELVEELKTFNISTATDQELADEFRRLSEGLADCLDEIKRRGFVVFNGGFKITSRPRGNQIKIEKKITETVVL